jgi:hypothetical protein
MKLSLSLPMSLPLPALALPLRMYLFELRLASADLLITLCTFLLDPVFVFRIPFI